MLARRPAERGVGPNRQEQRYFLQAQKVGYSKYLSSMQGGLSIRGAGGRRKAGVVWSSGNPGSLALSLAPLLLSGAAKDGRGQLGRSNHPPHGRPRKIRSLCCR